MNPSEDALTRLFPPFGLVVEAGPLVLRILRDVHLPAYEGLLRAPLFADPEDDVTFPWWREIAAGGSTLGSVQHQWRARAEFTPDAWALQMGVFAGERLVGFQDVGARDFALTRQVSTASYLHPDVRGRGWGLLMRQAVLVFAFDHLGATRAVSSAIVSNASSLAVSDAAGYVRDGSKLEVMGGRALMTERVYVTPELLRRPAEEVHVTGLTPALRDLLGADA